MDTKWRPQLTATGVPLYRALADTLAADIAAGRLAAGARLPTHRDLAWELRVTVGTVSRAYAEAARRGLIGGEVGRGTFVLSAGLPSGRAWPNGGGTEETADGFVDLSLNYPIGGTEAALLAAALAALAQSPDLGALLHYQPHAGRPQDRAAGAAWLRRGGFPEASAEQTIVTHGGQNGIAVLLSALTRPGDILAVEHLSYPGLKSVARQLGVQLVGLAMDEAGLRPDALDAACRTRGVKLLYTMPSLHNPTTVTMPLERRREIAAVARRHEIAVVEDDVYGFLQCPAMPTLCSLLPERGYCIASTSKYLAPGLRVGYVHVPPAAVEPVCAVMRASTYMVSPIVVAIATAWIGDGTADRLAVERRRLAAERQRLTATIFGPDNSAATLAADAASLHCWLTLPAPWRADDFATAAQRRGVGVTPASAFATGVPSSTPEAIRFCLGTAPTNAVLERALRTLADLVATLPGPEPYLSVV